MARRYEAEDAYSAGFHGDPEPDGLSAGGKAVHKMGRDDQAAGREHAGHASIKKEHRRANYVDENGAWQTSRVYPSRPTRARVGKPTTPKPAKAPTPTPPTNAQQLRRMSRVQSAVPGVTDASGLLLAVVLYPLFMAVIKYGSAGPGLWFRAKWLNEVPGGGGNGAGGAVAGGAAIGGSSTVGGAGAVAGAGAAAQPNPSQTLPRTRTSAGTTI